MPNWLIDEPSGTVPLWVEKARCLQCHDVARDMKRKTLDMAERLERNGASERLVNMWLSSAIGYEREADIFLKAAIETGRL